MDAYQDEFYLAQIVSIEEQRLTKLFALAREQYFPRWDSKNEWRIVAGQRKNSKGETGYCSTKERRIYIDPFGIRYMPDDGLLALIIHEICHDLTTAYHKERWVIRMEKAAKKAELLNKLELARQIRGSVYSEILTGENWHNKWCEYLYPLIQ